MMVFSPDDNHSSMCMKNLHLALCSYSSSNYIKNSCLLFFLFRNLQLVFGFRTFTSKFSTIKIIN